MKELKFLYETTVEKQVEEKVTDIREENGQKVEITRTVKKSKPIKLAILKPGRRLYEGADIFYAKQIADFIRAGLLPYSLVAKRYANDGGALSEPEKVRLMKLKDEVSELEAKFFTLIEQADKTDDRNKLLTQINKINEEITTIQNAYADIFDNTAEIKARNKAIEWWALHLSYINEGEGYKPIFSDGTYDEKIDKYDELSEQESAFTDECIRKLSYLISFWFAARSALSKIDFESMDKLYQDTVTDYKIVNEETPKIIEVKDTPPAELLAVVEVAAKVAEVPKAEAEASIKAVVEAFKA
jgi:hypothetical protein